MNDKSLLSEWFSGKPLEKTDDIEGAKVATVGEPPTTVQQGGDAPKTQKNLAKLSPDVSFVAANGDQSGGYYSIIQGHKISRNNTQLRVTFIHSIIDIETSDAAGLRRVIYQRTHNEIQAGKSYDGVQVISVLITDSDSLQTTPPQ